MKIAIQQVQTSRNNSFMWSGETVLDTDGSRYMGMALSAAEAALAAHEVPIGCVFVASDGSVLATGRNTTVASCNGTRHAELEAIDEVLVREGKPAKLFAQATLYVTVEPCVMCASALRKLCVRRVVFGACNDKFGGCGSVLSIHSDGPGNRHPTYDVSRGVREEEAVALLRLFYAQQNGRAPEPQKRTKKQLAHAEGAGALLGGGVTEGIRRHKGTRGRGGGTYQGISGTRKCTAMFSASSPCGSFSKARADHYLQ